MSKVIEVRILASADPSLKTAIRPLVESVRLARQQTAAETKAMEADKIASVRRTTAADASAARDAARRRKQENNALLAAQKRASQEELRAFDSVMREKQRLAKIAAKEEEKLSRERAKAGDAAARDAERRAKAENDAILNQQKRRAKEEMRLHDDKLRAFKSEEREILRTATTAEKAAQKTAQRTGKEKTEHRVEITKDVVNRTGRNITALGRGALNVASEFAQGAGVDLSIGSTYGKAVMLRRGATDLSNAGYMPPTADSPGVARVDPAEIEKQIKSAADSAGFSRSDAMQGMQAFTGKTGRMKEGLDILKDLAKLSRATGTDLKDMADAAGDASLALGDDFAGDRGKAVVDIMKQMAGQGKIGAVEVKDLAVQMAALGAASGSFEGDKSEVIGEMGAIVQMSRAHGGSKSAAQAATSVSAMVNTLKTPARIKEFHEAGVDIYNEKTQLMRDPKEIIMDSIQHVKGNAEDLHKMWANVQGGRAVEGFANEYRQGRAKAMEGGSSEDEADVAGRQAMEKKFKEYKNTFMGEDEIDQSFKARMEDPDVRANKFNAEMEDLAEEVGDKLIPALEKLEPSITKLAGIFADAVSWASGHPWETVVAALGASVAKAGIDVALKEGIAKLIAKSLKSDPDKIPTPKVPNVVGPGPSGKGKGGIGVGGAMVLAATGITAYEGTTELVEGLGHAESTAKSRVENAGQIHQVESTDPLVMKEQLAELDAEKKRIDAMIEEGGKSGISRMATGGVSGMLNAVSGGSIGTSFEQQGDQGVYANHMKELKESSAKVAEAIERLHAKMSGTQTVIVANMPAGGGPFVDPGGRSPGTVHVPGGPTGGHL